PAAITQTALVDQVVQTMTAQAAGAAAGPTATVAPAATAIPQSGAAPAATVAPDATAVPQATAAPAATAVRPATAVQYTVQAGDWVYKIARAYGISVEELLAGNPGMDKDSLVPGQVITIPAAGQVVIAPTNTTVYTVQAGDTLFAIALRNNTTTAALATLNNITNPDTLAPGDVLRIPK
ncbi:MAG: LysM peptidoglycan-binding domain-containing protein, partial [Chloroflexi bacterium]|nr:LysM peptidoglycan-binding domain-containing protein [Chloroflexota bacterium]